MFMKQIVFMVTLFGFSAMLAACGILWWDHEGGGLPDRGLISHYPLDGDARDIVGNRHGEVIGTSPAENRFGEAGKALGFNGDGDFVQISDSEAFNFDLREKSYSISLWVKSDDVEKWARLVIKWNELIPTPYPFAIQKVGAEVWGGIYDTQENPTVTFDGAWDGEWHHVAVSYDAESNQLTGYLDGVLTARLTVEVEGTTQNASPVYIGRAASPVEDRYFEGSMDDMRFYSRALSEKEVHKLYEEE